MDWCLYGHRLTTYRSWRVVSQCVECACLQERMPNTVCWSNGNLFRCITLLAVTHLEKAGIVRIAYAAESLLVLCVTV